ncbi:MAG: anti-sigma factor [Myxococcales bacterium]|nr:anti-sigma factor [Myxococcales bacterium]
MKRTLSELETLRAQDLLVQRATHGLDDAEQAELVAIDAQELDDFELTAAAIDLATVPDHALPPGLADKIIADALTTAAFVHATARQASFTAPAVPAVAAALPERESISPIRPREHSAPSGQPRVPFRQRPGPAWVTAAAAIALAAGSWIWAGARTSGAPDAAPSFRALLDAKDPTRVLKPGSGAASGDVVWSNAQQRGYVRLVGLAINEPASRQYQIWIFDRARDPRYPVDGGLFDVTSMGEVIVPITPRIPVTDPVRFLVTAEKPGGTVVSDRNTVVFATE